MKRETITAQTLNAADFSQALWLWATAEQQMASRTVNRLWMKGKSNRESHHSWDYVKYSGEVLNILIYCSYIEYFPNTYQHIKNNKKQLMFWQYGFWNIW